MDQRFKIILQGHLPVYWFVQLHSISEILPATNSSWAKKWEDRSALEKQNPHQEWLLCNISQISELKKTIRLISLWGNWC